MITASPPAVLSAPMPFEANAGVFSGRAPRGTTMIRVFVNGRPLHRVTLRRGQTRFSFGPTGLPPKDVTDPGALPARQGADRPPGRQAGLRAAGGLVARRAAAADRCEGAGRAAWQPLGARRQLGRLGRGPRARKRGRLLERRLALHGREHA